MAGKLGQFAGRTGGLPSRVRCMSASVSRDTSKSAIIWREVTGRSSRAREIKRQAVRVRRREFIGLLGGTAVTWPYAARAQQPTKVHRIAIVSPSATVAEMNETGEHFGFAALFKELRRLGYVEGQNLVVERYSAQGR